MAMKSSGLAPTGCRLMFVSKMDFASSAMLREETTVVVADSFHKSSRMGRIMGGVGLLVEELADGVAQVLLDHVEVVVVFRQVVDLVGDELLDLVHQLDVLVHVDEAARDHFGPVDARRSRR